MEGLLARPRTVYIPLLKVSGEKQEEEEEAEEWSVGWNRLIGS